MQKFIKRLKFYGIGFGIGLVFVFLFFQNRGCSWLPSNRVKNAILDRVIVVSDSTSTILKEKGITNKNIVNALNEGDVGFSESDKDKESKIYVIEDNGVKYAFTLPYESFISEVQIREENEKIYPSTTGYGRFIHYPNDENLVYPDSSMVVSCQQELLKLTDSKEILKLIKDNGKISFEKTILSRRPKPEHYLIIEKDKKEIGVKMIWYKNKLNITSFHAENTETCE